MKRANGKRRLQGWPVTVGQRSPWFRLQRSKVDKQETMDESMGITMFFLLALLREGGTPTIFFVNPRVKWSAIIQEYPPYGYFGYTYFR